MQRWTRIGEAPFRAAPRGTTRTPIYMLCYQDLLKIDMYVWVETVEAGHI